MMMMRVLMLMLVSSAKHDGAKELESAPKNTKRMKKTASSCTILLQGCRIEEVFDFCKEKKYDFTSCDGRRISGA